MHTCVCLHTKCPLSLLKDKASKEFLVAVGRFDTIVVGFVGFILGGSSIGFAVFVFKGSSNPRSWLHSFQFFVRVFVIVVVCGTNNGWDFTQSAMVHIVKDPSGTTCRPNGPTTTIGKDTLGVAFKLIGRKEHSTVQENTTQNQDGQEWYPDIHDRPNLAPKRTGTAVW